MPDVAGYPDARLDAQLPAHCCRPLPLHAGPDEAADAVLRVRPRQLAVGGLHSAALPHLHHLLGPGGK